MKRALLLAAGVILLLFGLKYLGDTCFTKSSTNNQAVYFDSLKSKTVSLKITGMTCPNCAAAIEKNLKSDKGVLLSDIKFDNAVNTVTYDPAKTNPAKIIESIQKAGYKAEGTNNSSKNNLDNIK